MTAAAQWLNETFATFDHTLLEFFHNLNVGSMGWLFDPVLEFISILGDEGICLIIFSLILMVFKKTRKVGAAMLGGIIIGALFTNITIKPIVARPRPFQSSELYNQWFIDAGSHMVGEKSFPSGHTTSAMAAMTGLFFTTNKKISWTAFLFAIVMGISRIYLCVHYPSDVLGGLIIGFIAGLLAGIIVNVCYKSNIKLFKKIFDFDLFSLFKKKKS